MRLQRQPQCSRVNDFHLYVLIDSDICAQYAIHLILILCYPFFSVDSIRQQTNIPVKILDCNTHCKAVKDRSAKGGRFVNTNQLRNTTNQIISNTFLHFKKAYSDIFNNNNKQYYPSKFHGLIFEFCNES